MSVTIRNIAEAAHVSVATVSRALNNSPAVTDKTRERVFTVANKLGYVPNSVAKSLKTNHTQTIGFMVSDITNSDYISIARIVEDIVRPRGYNLILCSTGNRREQELDYLKMLFSKSIDGLILNTTGFNNSYILKMNEKLPIVLLNRSISSPKFHGDFVSTNSYLGSYLLTQHLLALGHRRIFVVRGPLHLNNSVERFLGFADAMEQAGCPVGVNYPYVYCGEYTRENGINAVIKALSMDPLPTAIISHSNMPMLGILEELHRREVGAPKLSLASYDDIPSLNLMKIQPTIAHFDTIALGRQVARSILEHIQNPQIEHREYIFDPCIVPGNLDA